MVTNILEDINPIKKKTEESDEAHRFKSRGFFINPYVGRENRSVPIKELLSEFQEYRTIFYFETEDDDFKVQNFEQNCVEYLAKLKKSYNDIKSKKGINAYFRKLIELKRSNITNEDAKKSQENVIKSLELIENEKFFNNFFEELKEEVLNSANKPMYFIDPILKNNDSVYVLLYSDNYEFAKTKKRFSLIEYEVDCIMYNKRTMESDTFYPILILKDKYPEQNKDNAIYNISLSIEEHNNEYILGYANSNLRLFKDKESSLTHINEVANDLKNFVQDL